MDGVFIVDKPSGWTSFDVCAKLRNLTKTKKVGHSGTLDPMATGVLPVFLGKATKSIQHFIGGDKGYVAEMTLGATSDTLDADGKIIEMPSPPIPLSLRERGRRGGEGLDLIVKIFKKYIGEIEQTPPMYSAVKIKGKPLYKLARQGIVVERQKKKIKIYKLELLGVEGNKIRFQVMCSKGTYIRVLASEIGDDLGCGAYLSALERVYSHPFHISQAIDIVTLQNLAKVGRLESVLLTPEEFANI